MPIPYILPIYLSSIEDPQPPVPGFMYELSGAGLAKTIIALAGRALPQGRDLALDPQTGDLLLTAGDLSLVSDLEAIRQEILIRLQFLRGSWFLDTTAGLPYFESILVKSPNLAAIRTLFNNEILSVTGVNAILSLTLDFDRKSRKLTVTYSVSTDVGQLDSNMVL